MTFQKPWVLGDEMLRRLGSRLPHRWIVADSEFGEIVALPLDRLAKRGERYMLEVPSNILVRKVAGKAGPPAGVAPRPRVPEATTDHRVDALRRS